MNKELEIEAYGLLQRALELDADRRRAFVDSEAGTNHELRHRVVGLLDMSDVEDDFLETPGQLSLLDADLPPANVEGLDRYEFLGRLGSGGMGMVYLARDCKLDRKVAVKFLRPLLTISDDTVERFRREARVAAGLQHPGIVQVHDFVEHAGAQYIVMDYVAGESLDVLFEDKRDGIDDSYVYDGRQLDRAAWGATIVRDIAETLQYLHDNGVVHRDVKPANVLIDGEGRPRIADFGLCKDLDVDGVRQSSHLLGTLSYMSPEQTWGGDRPVDARTDVYSAGAVLFEALAQRPPYEGNDGLIVQRIREDDPSVRAWRPDVPRDLELVCLKAMAKDPDERYQRAGDFADDLGRFLRHEAVFATPPTFGANVRRLLFRHRRRVQALAISAVAVAGGVLLTAFLLAEQRRDAGVATVAGLVTSPWDDVELAELLHGQTLAEELAKGDLDEDEERVVAAFGDRVREFVAERKRLGTEAIVSAHDETPWSRDGAIASGLRQLLEASLLSPEDRGIREQTSDAFWHPKLKVHTSPSGAEIRLQPLDSAGEPAGGSVELVGSPLGGHPVAPGYYRVTVTLPGLGHAESTVILARLREEVEVALDLRSTAEVTAGMVFIPAGPARVGNGTEGLSPFPERTVELSAFWIDRTEVTNADYKRFVDDTGHPAPAIWEGEYDPAWDRLPVVGVSYHDAARFARWAGKRLPTLAEWERAARGPSGYAYPWGDEKTDLDAAVLGRKGQKIMLNDPDRWRVHRESYLASVEPADVAATASPDGLLHTLGNVAEWTETLSRHQARLGIFSPQAGLRVTKGGGWPNSPVIWNLEVVSGAPADAVDRAVGFRCAKSTLDDR